MSPPAPPTRRSGAPPQRPAPATSRHHAAPIDGQDTADRLRAEVNRTLAELATLPADLPMGAWCAADGTAAGVLLPAGVRRTLLDGTADPSEVLDDLPLCRGLATTMRRPR